MAPTKKQTSQTTMATAISLTRKGVGAVTRRGNTGAHDQNMNVDPIQTRGKRKAEYSPGKNDKVKRSALGNLTNNVKTMTMTDTNTMLSVEDANVQTRKKKDNHILGNHAHALPLKSVQNIGSGEAAVGVVTRQAQTNITTRAAASKQQQQQHLNTTLKKNSTNYKNNNNNNNNTKGISKLITAAAKVTKIEPSTEPPKEKRIEALGPPPAPITQQTAIKVPYKTGRRISNEFNKTEESLYMSALEDISSCESSRLSDNFEAAKRRSAVLIDLQQIKDEKTDLDENKAKLDEEIKENVAVIENIKNAVKLVIATGPPEGVNDFDKANWNDPFQLGQYTMDIFNYLKEREAEFPIDDYMPKQIHLSKWMRTLLVDWMVEVQETFELNHETLYLAVKIVDLFMCRVVIHKEKLQLLGAAAFFIACKFDERVPPLIDDFLYICDGAYKHEELIHMEMTTLRTIGYDLGIPLSYSFLRRYARCAQVIMPTLTLARYILELSLMDYETIRFSDSKLACAALFIALRMCNDPKPWTPTLEYYSSYELTDFAEIVPILNDGLHRKHKHAIKTIRSKYSHQIFYEVAKTKVLTTEELFEGNLDFSLITNGDKQTN